MSFHHSCLSHRALDASRSGEPISPEVPNHRATRRPLVDAMAAEGDVCNNSERKPHNRYNPQRQHVTPDW